MSKPFPFKKSTTETKQEPDIKLHTIDEVGDKLKLIEQNAFKYLGHEGCNPFLWRHNFLEPLIMEVKENFTQDLAKKILALPDDIKPVVE